MRHKYFGPYEQYIKRPLDCMLATGMFVVLSPVLGVTAVLVKTKLGSPVLFTQERPGKDEKVFKLYKFRTMTDDRGPDGELLPDEDRLTELINIIKGDMALVGPRPLLVRYLPRYNAEQKRRHEVRPGLTGLAQVHGRNAASWSDKFKWDVRYVDKITFAGDLKILLDTVRTVLKREGITDGTATMEEFMGNA